MVRTALNLASAWIPVCSCSLGCGCLGGSLVQHPAQGLAHGRCSKGFDRSRVRLLFMVSGACCVSSLLETQQISAHPLSGTLPTTPFPSPALGLAAPTGPGLWVSTFHKSTELICPGLCLHCIRLTLCPVDPQETRAF